MKINTRASGGASGSGMEENPVGLSRPWSPSSRRQPSRPAGPRQTAKTMRFDPSSPGLLSRLPDDGDGMDQARHPSALTRPLRKDRKMHMEPSEKQPGNAALPIPESGEIAYNLREGERPGGMKVRYKIKIVTGPKARELDQQHAEIIRDLLIWARRYRAGQEGKKHDRGDG